MKRPSEESPKNKHAQAMGRLRWKKLTPEQRAAFRKQLSDIAIVREAEKRLKKEQGATDTY